MGKKNKGGAGKNKQGIKTLDHIKGKSVGIVLEMPPVQDEKEAMKEFREIDTVSELNQRPPKNPRYTGRR